MSAAGSPSVLAPFTYKWNNGGNNSIVTGTELGTYIVTVTDKCGNTTSRATVVNESIWNPAPSVEIEPSEENSFCRTGKVGLIARAAASGNNNGIVKYEWSAGNSTSNQVLVDGEGKYTVTVTDACNLTATDEYLTGELGIACLRFPRIFFATDSVAYEGNALFGAINKCGVDSTEVKEYELHVFDRWGKEVFSTTDVTETWDARLPDSTNSGPGNTDKYPPDVYVWYARYKVGEFCAFEGKGEVTLFW
ncbi:MAG: gliding motility-associated C-terminal domain-containing protein [Saprospiraceae bacterium]|nr:gliding motility-associated C-terminal domain-containing protein [Saprospiraceae bacterium]